MHKKVTTKNRYKLQRLALKLLEGPVRLAPPEETDSIGILIPCLNIQELSFALRNKPSAYGIYVDNTVNRHEDFLTPIARYAVWDRQSDLKSEKDAPAVTIVQHILSKEEQTRLHNLLLELDKEINNLKFLVGGLITDRGDPEGVTYEVGFRDLEFYRNNSTQNIHFSFGQANNQNLGLEIIIKKLMIEIKRMCVYEEALEENYEEVYR